LGLGAVADEIEQAADGVGGDAGERFVAHGFELGLGLVQEGGVEAGLVAVFRGWCGEEGLADEGAGDHVAGEAAPGGGGVLGDGAEGGEGGFECVGVEEGCGGLVGAILAEEQGALGGAGSMAAGSVFGVLRGRP